MKSRLRMGKVRQMRKERRLGKTRNTFISRHPKWKKRLQYFHTKKLRDKAPRRIGPFQRHRKKEHIQNRRDSPQIEEVGLEAAYEEGYRLGLFEGGEAKVGQLIPGDMILPEITVDDLIRIGYEAMTPALMPLITPSEVYIQLITAMNSRQPLSVIRLGDGELLTLAHDTVMTAEEAVKRGPFLPYAGVRLPDPVARNLLAEAIRTADIVGVPQSRHPSYQGLLFPVLRHYSISYHNLRMTSSTINYSLNEQGYLPSLLRGRRVVIIGNFAAELAYVLGQHGVTVTGIVAPVQGIHDIPRIMEQVHAIQFDLALVAAGIAAVVLCQRIANECRAVALDFGHLANKLVHGETSIGSIRSIDSEVSCYGAQKS